MKKENGFKELAVSHKGTAIDVTNHYVIEIDLPDGKNWFGGVPTYKAATDSKGAAALRGILWSNRAEDILYFPNKADAEGVYNILKLAQVEAKVLHFRDAHTMLAK